MYQYSATLLAIHDGDTMHFDVDLGFSIHSIHPLRLYGVNAPELSTPAGKLSLAWVVQWYHDHPGPYLLNTVQYHETEKYGRYLATVTAQDLHVLNVDIVAAGQAIAYLP